MPPQRNATTLRERQNWLIHMQYIRQEYDDALKTIDQQLKDCRGMAEYPIYVKALIKRQRGEINDSLQLFQAATGLNPHNIANLKQVGRSLYLLARHRAALDVYEEALRIGVDDWEIWHNKGLCNMYLKQYDLSADCFRRANSIQVWRQAHPRPHPHPNPHPNPHLTLIQPAPTRSSGTTRPTCSSARFTPCRRITALQ